MERWQTIANTMGKGQTINKINKKICNNNEYTDPTEMAGALNDQFINGGMKLKEKLFTKLQCTMTKHGDSYNTEYKLQ